MIDRSILIFGAGKIGRSFIGQLFGNQSYEVVFVDLDRTLVEHLNRRRSYTVVIKETDGEERIKVENVRAIHGGDRQAVVDEITRTGIMAISVGKAALSAVAPLVAGGLMKREQQLPEMPLDIILAENMRSAGPFFRVQLKKTLPEDFPLDRQVGLVETSIGKMVPLMPADGLKEDPLQVYAEAYNTLILSRPGFRGKIPDIPEFALKDNMKAWVDRKAFIHNLGHATAAYSGHLEKPGATYMWEVLGIESVCSFTRDVMQESAEILLSAYPEEFSRSALHLHIEDLIRRFRNRNLGDTVFRVGSDLKRKLGSDDRFMGIIRMAQKLDKPHGKIVEAMAGGFRFRATGSQGKLLPEDQLFRQLFLSDPEKVLEEICGVDPGEDAELFHRLMRLLP